MRDQFDNFTALARERVIDALKKIDANQQGFVIVTDEERKFLGVLTDGDIRRAFIRGCDKTELVGAVCTKNAKTVSVSDSFGAVTEIFKNQSIKFLPVLDEEKRLVNIVTKSQMHALLLRDIHADLRYDFLSVDASVIDHEIFQRPWGFYKTTVLNDYYQAKIISVRPGEELSLQSHCHREEHWVVVHGTGIVQLERSFLHVTCGSVVFIPIGAKHRAANTDEKENLIIAEVQIGSYLGEDDIVRYQDRYGRA